MGTSMYDAMYKYLQKAIDKREKFFRLATSAEFSAGEPGTPYAQCKDVASARYQFEQSDVAKALVAENNWHMGQSIMFGMVELVESNRRQEVLLEKILKEL